MGNKEEELEVCMWLQSWETFGIAEASWDSSKGWIQALWEGWGGEARKWVDLNACNFVLERVMSQPSAYGNDQMKEGQCCHVYLLETN